MRFMPLLQTMALILAAFQAVANAQEFRIYTRVSLVSGAGGGEAKRSDVIARSLTLFHAGKTYDYIDTVGEVIIFEPGQRRFLILHTGRDVATSVDFEELNNLLKIARQETEAYVTRLENDADESSRKKAMELRFQLSPQFEEQWDPKSRRLSLSSRFLRYNATCAVQAAPQESLDAWSRYADAMCRLNYVLHPGAMFPEPRLMVNAAMSRLQTLPTEVELMTDGEMPLHLVAQHQMHWELDAKDRSLIHHWESLLKRKSSEMLSFQEYQRAVLTAPAAKKR